MDSNKPDYLRLTRETQTFVAVAFLLRDLQAPHCSETPHRRKHADRMQLALGERMNSTPCNSNWPAQTLACETCGRTFSSEYYSRVDVALQIHGMNCKPMRAAQ